MQGNAFLKRHIQNVEIPLKKYFTHIKIQFKANEYYSQL